jgi:hypothetical protein
MSYVSDDFESDGFESDDFASDDFASVFASGCSVFADPSESPEPDSASFPAVFREPRP